jgi:hypothetical protein
MRWHEFSPTHNHLTQQLEMTIPASAVGRLIGRYGSRIHELAVMSGTHLEIRPGMDTGEARVCIEGMFHETQVRCLMLAVPRVFPRVIHSFSTFQFAQQLVRMVLLETHPSVAFITAPHAF